MNTNYIKLILICLLLITTTNVNAETFASPNKGFNGVYSFSESKSCRSRIDNMVQSNVSGQNWISAGYFKFIPDNRFTKDSHSTAFNNWLSTTTFSSIDDSPPALSDVIDDPTNPSKKLIETPVWWGLIASTMTSMQYDDPLTYPISPVSGGLGHNAFITSYEFDSPLNFFGLKKGFALYTQEQRGGKWDDSGWTWIRSILYLTESEGVIKSASFVKKTKQGLGVSSNPDEIVSVNFDCVEQISIAK